MLSTQVNLNLEQIKSNIEFYDCSITIDDSSYKYLVKKVTLLIKINFMLKNFLSIMNICFHYTYEFNSFTREGFLIFLN